MIDKMSMMFNVLRKTDTVAGVFSNCWCVVNSFVLFCGVC